MSLENVLLRHEVSLGYLLHRATYSSKPYLSLTVPFGKVNAAESAADTNTLRRMRDIPACKQANKVMIFYRAAREYWQDMRQGQINSQMI